jgi:hypothetical protein
VRDTPAERAAMSDRLAPQIELATQRRTSALPHDLPPATLFGEQGPVGWPGKGVRT